MEDNQTLIQKKELCININVMQAYKILNYLTGRRNSWLSETQF